MPALRADFYQRLQGLYGAPGSDSSLETSFNNFTESLQSLVTSPDSAAARSVVLSSAQVLAQTLNSVTTDIQALRGDAEGGLSDPWSSRPTNALKKIAALNKQLAGIGEISSSDAALMDQRDDYIDQLSELMDIRIVTDSRNQVNIFTNSGIQLVGADAAQLSFTPQGTVSAATALGPDPTKNNLGSITLVSAPNQQLDSDRQPVDSLRENRCPILDSRRDNVLVQA